ncbi:MAG: response regulator transcription factor [Chloroflexota bacterium]|nr:response regulator transcription factor [Chloroflexota bacterium]
MPARPKANRSLRLLLVDDHKIVRMGLREVFATAPWLRVVGEAESVAGAIAEADRHSPDVVLMDLRLPDGDGVQACRAIRAAHPQTQVLILTSFNDSDALFAAIKAGAAGYLLKRSEPERLIEAVQTVAAGGSLLDSEVTKPVFDFLRDAAGLQPRDPLGELTPQEQRILPLLADGRTNREIAAALSLSPYTVKAHVGHILEKLHLSRRVEAATYFVRRDRETP